MLKKSYRSKKHKKVRNSTITLNSSKATTMCETKNQRTNEKIGKR